MKKLFSICLWLLCQLAAIAQTTHTVTIGCSPTGACRLNLYTQSVGDASPALQAPVGSKVQAEVYPITGFILDSLVADGSTLSTYNTLYNNGKAGTFTMPDHDVSVMAYLHYDPTLPPNPSESGWDETTGSLLVNNFTTNSLLAAISAVVYNSATNSYDYAKVKAITVVGTLSRYDWEMLIGSRFTNLAYLDVSRTTGLSTTSYDGYDRGYTLTTLLLPATVSTIGYNTFNNFTALRSITCYAATPPKVENNGFSGVPTDATVYVPAESLPLYMEADVWKDFDLQPITQGVHKLTVNIPAAQGKTLKDMFLELTNTQTSQTQRYVLTNQTTYTYNNLIEGTQYNVYIRNARNDILGTIEAVSIEKEDVQVEFTALKQLRDVALRLTLPDGTPAREGDYTVTWTDALGNHIAQGNTLRKQMEGTKAIAKVKLSETLGTRYQQPADTLITVAQASTVGCQLSNLETATLSGTVTAKDTEEPIRGANIAVTQLLNGLYPVTLTTTTDGNGRWTLTASNAPTEVTAQATGYAPQKTAPDLSKEREVSFVLPELVGTTIRLDPYFRPAVRAGEEQVSADDYEGLQNISYTVYDVTNNRELTNFTVQNGQLVLQDQMLAEGTQVRITATSMKGEFAAATTVCTINADGEATATLPLVQLGQLIATFSQTDNGTVAGMLYDGDGQLLGMDYYETPDEGCPLLTFTNLADGHYTLITMGESRLYNFVNTIDALGEMGLLEGRDYVKSEVDIESGRIDSLHNQLIPMFDETVFSYTDEGTGFRANKQLLTIGTIATLQTIVTFKPQVQPADVGLLFDLPDGCQFIEGSVMAGNRLAAYEYGNGRLRVPSVQPGEQVRFCIAPVAEGVYAPTASVSFSSKGRNVVQSLGTAIFTAQALSIEAPQQTSSGIVSVSGAAPSGSQVMIYDDDVLIGQTEASVAGVWQQRCLLSNPYNLSQHDVYAVVTTADGTQLQSATCTVAVVYGSLSPVVNMSFVATGSQQVVTWDFREEAVTPTRYVCQDTNFREPICFDIDFVDDDGEVANDTTIISDVVLYVVLEDNSILTLYPRFNKKKGCWHAAYNIATTNMPVTVYVECLQDDDVKADRRMMDDILAEAEAAIQNEKQVMRDIYALFDEEPILEERPIFDELHTLLSVDSLTTEHVERIDSLVHLLVGDDVEAEPYAKQKEFDELHELLQNDDTDDATMQRILELLAYIQDDEIEQPAPDTDLQALTDSINAWFSVLREDMIAWQELTGTTDTTQWQRPEGDMAFEIPFEDGIVKQYEAKQLTGIDREQLLADGYTEIKMNDGTSVFYLFSDEKTCFVDTRNKMLYTTKVSKSQSARARIKDSFTFTGILNKDCWSAFNLGSLAHITKTEILLGQLTPESTLYDINSTYIPQTCSELNDLCKAIKCVYEDAIKALENYAKNWYSEHILKETNNYNEANKKLPKKLEDLKTSNELLKREQKIADDLAVKRRKLLDEFVKAQVKGDRDAINAINQKLIALAEPERKSSQGLNAAKNLVLSHTNEIESLKKIKIKANNARILLKVQQSDFFKKLKPFKTKLSLAMKTKWVRKIGDMVAKFVGTPLSVVLQAVQIYYVTLDIINDYNEWDKLYDRITKKLPCEGMRAEAKALQFAVGLAATEFVKTSFSQWKADVIGMSLDLIDVPATPQWFISVGFDIYSTVISLVRPWLSNKTREALRKSIDALDCKKKPKPKEEPKPTKPINTPPPPSEPPSNSLGAWHRWGNQTQFRTTPIHVLPGSRAFDPSGFVYEAVSSNRLEGVTATCYHKQMLVDEWGDMYEDDVVWMASSYRQENPLITDAEGRYAWDVPQGLWQVRYEKEGYELKRSEWLPVPPPQLDVNVGMTQLRQPQVESVKACPEGIDIAFDKYMRPHTLTTEHIFVTKGGQHLGGTIELLNADSGYETPDSVYASRLRFVPAAPLLPGEKVQLIIRRSVESYAGLQMEQDYTQEFPVEPRVTRLQADSLLNMADGSQKTIAISALPAEAAKGKKVSISTTGGNIVTASSGELTLDENGQALLTLTAQSLGSSVVTFTLADADALRAQLLVVVNDSANMVTDAPTASRMSGTEVYRGAEIRLTSHTAGATILYTLDGTCPCDAQSASVLTYRGPIVATGNELVIRAMAVAKGMAESETVEFRYKVIDNVVGIEVVPTDEGRRNGKATIFYRLDGRQTAKPQRGLNIVREADGSVHKVVVH